MCRRIQTNCKTARKQKLAPHERNENKSLNALSSHYCEPVWPKNKYVAAEAKQHSYNHKGSRSLHLFDRVISIYRTMLTFYELISLIFFTSQQMEQAIHHLEGQWNVHDIEPHIAPDIYGVHVVVHTEEKQTVRITNQMTMDQQGNEEIQDYTQL